MESATPKAMTLGQFCDALKRREATTLEQHCLYLWNWGLRFACRKTRKAIDAEDITGEAMEVFWKLIQRGSFRDSSTPTWAFFRGIAIRVMLKRNQQAKQARDGEDGIRDVTGELDNLPAHDDVHEAAVIALARKECKSRLNEQERLIAELYEEGYTYVEIACIIGISQGAARRLVWQTIKKYRTCLSDQGAAPEQWNRK